MKKLYKRETFKSKEEWLNNRGFGGSSASAILGCNPYITIIDLYKSIVFGKAKKIDETNESMQYGTRCEPLIRELFKYDFENKYKVHSPSHYEMFRRKDKPYLTATLDGIITDLSSGEKGILEIKTHDIKNMKDADYWSDYIPQNYYVQCLHYLVVMNDFSFVILCAKLRYFDYYDPNGKKILRQEIRYYRLERKELEKELNMLEKKETDFYENNVLKKIMPTLKIKF